jgi:glycosyltransferase involved in cell wall biosynthesis
VVPTAFPAFARPLLCVAPLVPSGGVATLLTAFGLLADDRPALDLEVVGGGPLSRVLRAHAQHLGLHGRVHFCGPLSAQATQAAVHRCSMLVLPHRDDGSGRRHTPPAALLEALACARPVVATPAVAPPDVVRDGETGVLVPPDDPPALAMAVADLLDDPVRAAGMGVAGSRASAGLGLLDSEGNLLRRAWHRVTG